MVKLFAIQGRMYDYSHLCWEQLLVLFGGLQRLPFEELAEKGVQCRHSYVIVG
jgi:hypothetical protein